MSTVSIRPSSVKLDRKPRVFGQGITDSNTPPSPTLAIRGVSYAVEVLRGDEGEAVVRLVKQSGDGAVYDCVRSAEGHAHCDCPSFLYRKDERATCKHIVAVEAAGLFPVLTAPLNYQAAEEVLERFGYGISRKRKALDAIKAEGGAMLCRFVDRQDRSAVQAALVSPIRPAAPSWPTPRPRPVAPVAAPAPVTTGGWDLSSLDLGTDGPAPDVAWTPEAVAAFLADERARLAEGETVPGSAIGREVDAAWWSGHTLGRLGVDAEPPAEWTAHERAAFRNGMHWGRIDEEADREEAHRNELAMLASLNGPAERDLW